MFTEVCIFVLHRNTSTVCAQLRFRFNMKRREPSVVRRRDHVHVGWPRCHGYVRSSVGGCQPVTGYVRSSVWGCQPVTGRRLGWTQPRCHIQRLFWLVAVRCGRPACARSIVPARCRKCACRDRPLSTVTSSQIDEVTPGPYRRVECTRRRASPSHRVYQSGLTPVNHCAHGQGL